MQFQPLTENTYKSHTKRINFNPSAQISNNEEEFHPFTPSYQKSSNYQYIAFGKYADTPRTSTSRYVDNYTPRTNKINRYPIKYKQSPVLILQGDYSQIEPLTVPNQSQKQDKNNQITQALVSPYTETTNTTEELQDKSEDSTNHESTESANNETLYNAEYDHFQPPPEFFKSENKYANIKNPFANPNFDFDEFLKRFEDFLTTTAKPTEKVTTTRALPPHLNVTDISPGLNNHRSIYSKVISDYADGNGFKDDKNINNKRYNYPTVDPINYVYKHLGNGSVLVIPKADEKKIHPNYGCVDANNSSKSICNQDIKQEPKPFSKANQLNKSNDYYYYYDGYEDEPYSDKDNKKNNKDYIYYYEDYYYPEFNLSKSSSTNTTNRSKPQTLETERQTYNVSSTPLTTMTTTTTSPITTTPITTTSTTTTTVVPSTVLYKQNTRISSKPKYSLNTNRGLNRINRPLSNTNRKRNEEKIRHQQTTTQSNAIGSKKLRWKGNKR